MKIANASSGRCVARGISTMRLALGYEQPLPFPIDYSPNGREMAVLIGKCFPDRKVLLACKLSVIDGADLPTNVEYLGDYVNGSSYDAYLWCFSYTDGGDKAHFVIGSPEFHLEFYQVFAVELEDEKVPLRKRKEDLW